MVSSCSLEAAAVGATALVSAAGEKLVVRRVLVSEDLPVHRVLPRLHGGLEHVQPRCPRLPDWEYLLYRDPICLITILEVAR